MTAGVEEEDGLGFYSGFGGPSCKQTDTGVDVFGPSGPRLVLIKQNRGDVGPQLCGRVRHVKQTVTCKGIRRDMAMASTSVKVIRLQVGTMTMGQGGALG